MTGTNDSPKPNADEQLADFTDRVLSGTIREVDPRLDDELRGLEETVLRLNQTLPKPALDESLAKRMQVRMRARIRTESDAGEHSLWRKLFPPNLTTSPQLGFTLAAAALVVLLIVLIPGLSQSNSSNAATAFNSNLSMVLAVVLTAAIVLIFWTARRK